MPGHGSSTRAKPSAFGGFPCIVCRKLVQPGDEVVGYRNLNKPGKSGWDHVHARDCADKYIVPALESTKQQEPLLPVARPCGVDGSAQFSLPESTSPSSAEEVEEYTRLASKLEVDRDKALSLLSDHGGDVTAASRALASNFAAETTAMQPLSAARDAENAGATDTAPVRVEETSLYSASCDKLRRT